MSYNVISTRLFSKNCFFKNLEDGENSETNILPKKIQLSKIAYLLSGKQKRLRFQI